MDVDLLLLDGLLLSVVTLDRVGVILLLVRLWDQLLLHLLNLGEPLAVAGDQHISRCLDQKIIVFVCLVIAAWCIRKRVGSISTCALLNPTQVLLYCEQQGLSRGSLRLANQSMLGHDAAEQSFCPGDS